MQPQKHLLLLKTLIHITEKENQILSWSYDGTSQCLSVTRLITQVGATSR